MWATQKCNLEIAEELVSNGASVTKPKKDGINPFHMAASNNDIHMLDYFIQLNQHQTLEMQNIEGWTPAHMAGMLNNFDALNLLIENGVDLEKRNRNKLTVYEEIVRSDNADLLECIYPYVKDFQHKRNLKQEGTFGIVHLAASSGPKCLEFLLEKAKEYPNQICNDKDKATPLHFAVLSENQDNLRVLVRNGANVNARDSAGNTPLHFAVTKRSLKLVKLLEEFGADATIENADEICAIDLSITEDIKEIKMHFMTLSKYNHCDFSGLGDHRRDDFKQR